jgi:hypothetical protein
MGAKPSKDNYEGIDPKILAQVPVQLEADPGNRSHGVRVRTYLQQCFAFIVVRRVRADFGWRESMANRNGDSSMPEFLNERTGQSCRVPLVLLGTYVYVRVSFA